MNLNDLCAFCGNRATSKDHIPPESIFHKPRPSNLIKVPACQVCNGGSKLDDEYFRDAMLTGITEQQYPEVMALFIRKVEEIGTDPKKRGYGWATYKSLREIEIYTPAGIYLGKAPARLLDRERLLKSVGKYVRGLYFHHFKHRVPYTCEVTAHYYGDLQPQSKEFLFSQTAPCEPRNIGGGAFVYKFAQVPDDPRSIWLMQFYSHHCFVGIVSSIDETEEHPSKSNY
jgi:hypothetical protein